METWNSLDKFLEIYNVIRPFLDIVLISFLLYKTYQLIMRTQGLQIIRALIIFAVIYVVAIVLNLTTVLWIMNKISGGIIVGFAIVFQPELRKIIIKLGQSDWFKSGNRQKSSYIESVYTAAEILSKQRRGMLVAFMRNNSLKEQIDTGVLLNADLSSSLLVTIFGHDTMMHDGAVVIHGGKVIAAGCFLPLSENFDIKKTFGTRHRAALGLSEQTDAIVLVVSEESGAISLAYEGHLYYDLTHDQILEDLERFLKLSSTETISEEV